MYLYKSADTYLFTTCICTYTYLYRHMHTYSNTSTHIYIYIHTQTIFPWNWKMVISKNACMFHLAWHPSKKLSLSVLSSQDEGTFSSVSFQPLSLNGHSAPSPRAVLPFPYRPISSVQCLVKAGSLEQDVSRAGRQRRAGGWHKSFFYSETVRSYPDFGLAALFRLSTVKRTVMKMAVAMSIPTSPSHPLCSGAFRWALTEMGSSRAMCETWQV